MSRGTVGDVWRRTARRLAGPRPAILMYHRVAAKDHDPWDLSVSPESFGAQIEHLARRRRPMRLDAFVKASIGGTLPRDAVAVTFDDGYLDNLTHALPILSAHRVPATIFVTTGTVDCTRPFWWDELGDLVFGCPGPVDGIVAIGKDERPLRWEPGAEAADWLGWEPPTSARQAVFFDLWTMMRKVSDAERCAALDSLRKQFDVPEVPSARAMTRDELRMLTAGGVFGIGAHSVTHPDLTSLSRDERIHEIAQSKRDCEAMVGTPVTGFAYPYGDFDDAVRADVVHCGFDWACTTRGGSVTGPSLDRFVLPRIGIGDWPVARFAAALDAA